MSYHFAVEMSLPPERIFPFFKDLERWFRLSPQWSVQSFSMDSPLSRGSGFLMHVEYDRSEIRVEYKGTVEEVEPGRSLQVSLEGDCLRHLSVSVVSAGDGCFLKYRETREPDRPFTAHESKELELWLRSVANYIQISNKTSIFSRLWKWFLDRYWLKMTPSGRRTVFFVVCAEGLSLAFFLLILLWILIFKKI